MTPMHAPSVTPDATTAPALVDLRALFPELWSRRAPGGAILDRGLKPMPPAHAAAFLASQVGLWRDYRRLCSERLARPAALHPQDRQRLRGQARRYRDYIDRAEQLLRDWG